LGEATLIHGWRLPVYGPTIAQRFYGPSFEAALAAAGIPHDVSISPEAGHSFMSDVRGRHLLPAAGRALMAVGYRPVEAEDA